MNFATDRRALTAGRQWRSSDQILPPEMLGYRNVDAYPLGKPNFKKAKAIMAAGHARCGPVTLYAFPNDDEETQVLKHDWAKIGCHVTIKTLPGSALFSAVGRRSTPFDAAGPFSWFADYHDPGDFITTLFDGSAIQADGNNDYAYLDVPYLNRQIHRAERLTGSGRIAAFANLDRLITTRYAPWVTISNRLVYSVVSKRVRGYVSQPMPWIPVLDVAAIRLKQ